jgi:hypothetical protein
MLPGVLVHAADSVRSLIVDPPAAEGADSAKVLYFYR